MEEKNMTDKKTKKEKPSYEIEYLRRATVDADYNYCEFRVKFDPSKIDSRTVANDTEKMVTYVRELTATEEPKIGKGEFKEKLEKAAKIPTKKAEPTEDIKISELKAGDKVNINVRFEKAGDVQAFINKADGSPGRYVKVDVADASGKMKLTLFGDQCDLIKDIKHNAWLQIENAYCKDYQGNLELSIAYGKMEVVYNG